MKHLDNEVIPLLWGKIGKNDQLSIQICLWLLLKNIKKFGR